MTLDEAIEHAEEVAQGQSELYDCYLQHGEQGEHVESCKKCASDHRQLAEWLKDYKQLREQTRWIQVSERLPEDGQRVLVDYCEEDVGIMIIRFNVPWDYGFKAWMPLPEPYKASQTEVESVMQDD